MFRDAYKEFHVGVKVKLDVFLKGGNDKEVIASGGADFLTPSSQPVTRHFERII